MMNVFKKWIGKSVYIQLKSGRFYNGKIIDLQFLESNPDICIVNMIDKFGKEIMFYSNEIEVWECKNES